MNREDANTILHKMSTFLDNNQMLYNQVVARNTLGTDIEVSGQMSWP